MNVSLCSDLNCFFAYSFSTDKMPAVAVGSDSDANVACLLMSLSSSALITRALQDSHRTSVQQRRGVVMVPVLQIGHRSYDAVPVSGGCFDERCDTMLFTNR